MPASTSNYGSWGDYYGGYTGYYRPPGAVSPTGAPVTDLGQGLSGMAGGVARGTQLVGRDPIESLEVFAPNEINRTLQSYAGQQRALEGLANQVGLERRVSQSRERAGRASDTLEGSFERSTRTLGLTGRQRKAARRTLSLQRKISEAEAGTRTRRISSAISKDATRALTGVEDELFGQELAGLTNLANAEGQRQVNEANRKAQKSAKKSSLLGTIAGSLIAAAPFLLSSSEKIKDKRGKAEGLLEKVENLRIERWNYKGENEEHIGPYAEEFNETFGVGEDHPGMISLVDAVGVLFGSVKELNKKVEARV